jgi:hypothetical protein
MGACSPTGGRNPPWHFAAIALLAWTLAAPAADNRQVFSGKTHAWLRAVGKLQVPGQRYSDGSQSHFLEDCSATLVAFPGRTQADTIITAWHCLELYSDLSQAITFTVVTASGEILERDASRLQDGGGMHADWAILRLDRAIPAQQIAALRVHPQAADPAMPVTMAGYSRDNGLGEAGRALTFDADCAITALERDFGDTNCTAFKGASGGPVVQLSDAGEPRVCGVISQGNGEGRSTFFPVSGFRTALNLYLN